MPNLVATQNPLMQPVSYEEQMYYTSQYFHQQYLVNSPHGGKYRRHTHFLRALRGIESYKIYVDHKDIIELAWKRTNTEGNPSEGSWKDLFQAAGWNPLTLLNATAQAALAHHLDDELSKQVSVAINTHAARQLTSKTSVPREWLEVVGQSIGAFVPQMITAQITPHLEEMKNEQGAMRDALNMLRNEQAQENKELRAALALQESINAKHEQELKDIFAPAGYLTAYVFIYDYIHGPDRGKYAKLFFRSYIDQKKNYDQLHMYAHQQMHARRLQPRKYLVKGHGEDFYYPLEVLQCAFEDFKHFIDTSPQILRLHKL